MNRALWRVALVTGFLVSGLLACTKTPAAQDSGRVALEAAIRHWVKAVNAQDATTLSSVMTGDVVLLDDASTVTGRDAAIRALREFVTRGKLVAMSREITIVGSVAWHVVGLAQSQKNGDVQARGQALEIWQRVNGEWQLRRRMATGVVQPEISVTRPPTNEPVLDQLNPPPR